MGKPSEKKALTRDIQKIFTVCRRPKLWESVSLYTTNRIADRQIGEPKSKSGYRTIPLTEEAVAILKKQKEKNKRISEISTEWKEFVFLCRKGTPVKNSTYDTALFKICDKAKISRFSMHILRHTFATRCIEAWMKPKTLQMLLVHSNIGITMNLYVHTTEEEKKKEMDLVAEALMAIWWPTKWPTCKNKYAEIPWNQRIYRRK